MQAFRVSGKINQSGQLIITESIDLAPGNVEVILLQSIPSEATVPISDLSSEIAEQPECEIPSLKEWLQKTPKVPTSFDPDQAKWEYLKEKHDL